MSHNADIHDRIYDEEQQPLVQISRDGDVNVCECFDREVINVHPRVVFAFIVTLSILSTCAALLVIRPEWNNALFPIMTTLCGLWVPSPAQAAGRMSHRGH
jgi:hypothetical protein